jgi:adenylate cyclase
MSADHQAQVELAMRTLRRSNLAANLSNVAGVVVVSGFIFLLFPAEGAGLASTQLNLLVAGPFLLLAFAAGVTISTRRGARTAAWLIAGTEPTREDRARVLNAPIFGFVLSASIWALGAVVLGVLNATETLAGGLVIAASILAGGTTTAALTSLTVERVIRPVTAIALSYGAPVRAGGPGVGGRMITAWLLGTGVPVTSAGLVLLGALTGQIGDLEQAATTAILLVAVALSVGLWMIYLTARTVAEPVRAMQEALARVEQGDFDTRIRIEDGTEVGLLQAGFNRMTAGLAERERLREAFGTYVDPDVAERVLKEGTLLEGEELEVTVLFLDVRGFTSFVERSSASEVVTVLNRLFELIIPIIRDHDGHVNKFLGDGLLAIFGAPVRLDDHADRGLAAALEVARAVRREFGNELRIGIGLNTGMVVAGNVGGAGRLEFSVVGDAVNTAARVEAATRVTGDTILITEATRERLATSAVELEARPAQAVKGKSRPVAVFAPSLFSST